MVGATAVASPVGVLELDTHSSSEANPSESSLPLVSVAPMVSPFLCSDDSKLNIEIPERHVSPTPHDAMLTRWRSRVASRSSSPTTSTLEIPTAPILPAPSATVAPSSEFPLALLLPHPRFVDDELFLSDPRRTFPLVDFTVLILVHITSLGSFYFRIIIESFIFRSFIIWAFYFESFLTRTCITRHHVADSSTPPRFVHPPLARTPWCSEAYLRWRSAPLSTMYPPMTSESSVGDFSSESSTGPSRKRCRSLAAIVTSSIHATRALVSSRADLLPPHKRFRDSISPEDSVEEDIDADVLEDIEADATAVCKEEVEEEVESSDRGTMEVGVDVVAGIDIPDAMLMPDAVERLEKVEESLQDISDHVIEIPLQRIEDIKMGQRELEARSLIASGERVGLLDRVASLERSNARLRGTLRMASARVDRFRRHVSFMESDLRQICRFRYYDMMRFTRLETFTTRRLGFCP
ncbi:hypothetical protein Tco_1488398 [Tanacetum coccineum]